MPLRSAREASEPLSLYVSRTSPALKSAGIGRTLPQRRLRDAIPAHSHRPRLGLR
jgi:hypothetical protein